MRPTWIGIAMVAACWSGSPSTSSTTTTRTDTTTQPSDVQPTQDVQPTDPGSSTSDTRATATQLAGPPRAPLDGQLRVQPASMCGGARVPDGYRGPPLAPVASARLVVVPGERYGARAPALEVITDATGRFTGTLPAGRYCIVRDGRGPRPSGASVGQYTDPQCLIQRWETCDAVVEVPVKAPVAIDIHEPCAWSICYFGPPPP